MGCVGCSCSDGNCTTGGISLDEYLKNFRPVIDEDDLVDADFDIVEVEFKGLRRDFFRNIPKASLATSDLVIVQADSGVDIGHVVKMGRTVAIKMQQKHLDRDSPEILEVVRKATYDDAKTFEENKAREQDAADVCRGKIQKHGLDMKFVDVEFRFDLQKITLYYTAEQRVDFRELVKDLAGQYRTRIQLVQISAREEAKRLGGIGTCGRTLCCSSWLTEFKQVNTDAAKYQNLALNINRLSGQCGRLKCCLNYELDSYMTQLRRFPAIDSTVKTPKGTARVEKLDIFRDEVWFHYMQTGEWEMLSLDEFQKQFAKK